MAGRLRQTAALAALAVVPLVVAPTAGAAATPHQTPATSGYWLESGDGGVFAFGAAPFFGSSVGRCSLSCYGFAALPDGTGYRVLDAGLTTAKAALYGFGAAADATLSEPADAWFPVAVASTPSGDGGWVLYGDGGAVQAFNNARFYGDGSNLGRVEYGQDPYGVMPYFVGIAPTPDGGGYWLAGADGGVFAYGDAAFYGSMGGRHLNAPVVGISATPDGRGYYLVAMDGGVFAFGDAVFAGSMAGRHLNEVMISIAANPTGVGYWTAAQDGGVFTFGGAPFSGSMGGEHLNRPVYNIVAYRTALT
jgi:hypothetical protein